MACPGELAGSEGGRRVVGLVREKERRERG